MRPYKTKEQEVAGRILATPGTMATTSHAIALHLFGPDIYEWEPETLAIELQEELDVQIDEDNLDRLHAIIATITSNGFYKDWVAFAAVCTTLNGENDPEDIAELSVAEMTWSIVEVLLNDDDGKLEVFSPDVASFVGVILDNEGFVSAPPQLSFASLPEKYLGSSSGPEIRQDQNVSEYNMGLVNEYLRDQAVLLYKQISLLPWIDQDKLESITEALSNEISSVANKKQTDPLYGN